MPQAAARHEVGAEQTLLLDADGIVRAAHQGEGRNLLRIAVTAMVAVFMAHYVSLAAGTVWLAAGVSAEGLGFFARARLRVGDYRYRYASLGSVAAISGLWVVHALVLWNTRDHVAQITSLVDLFSICLYAALGALGDLRITWSLMGAPLAALCFLLTSTLWREAPPPMAAFGTLASFGACAIIAANALALASLHRRLADALRKAEAANAAKDVFLSNMSHELRTPMNAVVGLASTLARAPLQARQRQMVDLIVSSSQTLNRLLSDILDAAKLNAGKMVLERKPIALEAAVAAAARLHGGAAAEKGVELILEAPPEAGAWVIADETRLSQIVSNLVSNAIKFTETGWVRVRVDVGEVRNGVRETVIEVSDTGPGFDEDMAGRLFGRFEQGLAPAGRDGGGTGLGLSICRSLAEAMGGEVQARSRPGHGSVFTVRVPLEAASPPLEPIAAENEGEAPPSLRVLVADDHEINRRTIGFMLGALGVDAVFATNGREAVDVCARDSFDAVLMDMQMPEMDGLEATRAIRSRESHGIGPRTPIIMISAHVLTHHVEAALSAGCDLHLSKPLTPGALVEGLRIVVQDRRAA